MKNIFVKGLILSTVALSLTACATPQPVVEEIVVSNPQPVIPTEDTIMVGGKLSIAIFDTPTFWKGKVSNPEVLSLQNSYMTEDGTQVVPQVTGLSTGTSTFTLTNFVTGKSIETTVTVK